VYNETAYTAIMKLRLLQQYCLNLMIIQCVQQRMWFIVKLYGTDFNDHLSYLHAVTVTAF